MPRVQASFDEQATLIGTTTEALAARLAGSGVSDLVVLSHGWGNTPAHARGLYDALVPLIATEAAGHLPSLGFLEVFWPSIWFPDPPGESVASASGASLADAAAQGFADPGKRKAMQQMGALVDTGLSDVGAVAHTTQDAAVAQFHALAAAVGASSGVPVEDTAERTLLDSPDPTKDYERLADTMGSAPVGDAQGIGDLFGKVWNGAKDVIRVASFWEMKARAGTVGERGLAPVLVALHRLAPAVRVHLVGHSFGARLVSFTLAGIPSPRESPVASLTLLQGAFSHWSFAPLGAEMPLDHPGALAEMGDRVHGPLVATFTPADWAVGRWYPKAAALARDDAQAVHVSRWGGMGADGFRGVPGVEVAMQSAGAAYDFTPGTFYRVDADAVIRDTAASSFAGAHSDLLHEQVAWLIVAAATAG